MPSDVLRGVPQLALTRTDTQTCIPVYFRTHPMSRVKGGCFLSPSILPIVAIEDQYTCS